MDVLSSPIPSSISDADLVVLDAMSVCRTVKMWVNCSLTASLLCSLASTHNYRRRPRYPSGETCPFLSSYRRGPSVASRPITTTKAALLSGSKTFRVLWVVARIIVMHLQPLSHGMLAFPVNESSLLTLLNMWLRKNDVQKSEFTQAASCLQTIHVNRAIRVRFTYRGSTINTFSPIAVLLNWLLTAFQGWLDQKCRLPTVSGHTFQFTRSCC